MKGHVLIFALLITAFSACRKPIDQPEVDTGERYFNFKLNRYISYNVDSIVLDIPSNVRDTFRFQVKEVLDSIYTDLSGRNTARVARYYRNDNSQPWVLRRFWVANKDNLTAQRVEENMRYVRLVFPVQTGREWNGNAQNNFKQWTYVYEDVGAPKQVAALEFENTVTVNQRDVFNIVEQERAQEIYAYDVGLVYKQLDTLRFGLSGGVSTLRTGLKYSMEVFDFGEE